MLNHAKISMRFDNIVSYFQSFQQNSQQQSAAESETGQQKQDNLIFDVRRTSYYCRIPGENTLDGCRPSNNQFWFLLFDHLR